MSGVFVAVEMSAAQTYLDNNTIYSNQDPNTETRRSDHFRMNFGHYNRDTATPMTEQLAQGNLQEYEQMWNRWVVEMGLHDINESTNPTYIDGNKYRANFNFLMTWNDGGGGGAYSSADAHGFFYAMSNTSNCRYDPPSGATPHEFGHVWEGTCAGFNGTNSSGMWWECTANWMLLQFLNSYPQGSGYLYNSVFYPAHGRDYYDSWLIWEAAKDDPRYGAAWVNSVWCNATADQQVNEYIIDRMIRLDASGSADKAGAIKDLWGDMAKKMVTWDYARQRWLIQANTPWNGDTWEWYTRCRAPLVKLPGTTGWYRPAREHIPEQFGFHFVPLTATVGTTVSCTFKPLSDFVRQSDWRACLVAVNTNGQASYSSMWNTGTNSITLSADQNQLYLMVIAVPKPMKIGDPMWAEYTRDSGLQFPYTVSFTNASPTHVIYPAQSHSGMVQHANGGGWKATTATVDASAYVGPDAQVLDTAQVKGNARIEERGVVRNNAQVRDNAVVSGHGMVYENAQVYGNAKVRDWAMVFGYTELYENAKAIEHSGCGGGSAASHNVVSGNVVMKGVTSVYSPSTFSGSLITDGDTANGGTGDHGVHFGWQWGQNVSIFPALTDNFYQYSGFSFERDNAVFACDELGINHGYLMNGCRTGVDSVAPTRGGHVLPLDGVSQYVELHNSINDFKDSTFAVWFKQTGGAADQRLWSLGDGTNKVMWLTPNAAGSGNLRFTISDGATTTALDGPAITTHTWNHAVVVFSGSTCTLYLNGTAVANSAAMTLLPDSLNAPLMENANYLGRGNAGNCFQGYLDDFRMYNKGMTATDVTTLYSTAAPAPVTVAADTTAPTPNAATWLVEPLANGDNSATMSATPGTDDSGWVEYYFTCVSGGGHDSGWVSFNKYTDVGLTPGSAPSYTVKMRDRSGNTTGVSSSAAATLATSSAGTASFSYGPIGIASGQITMTATKVSNASCMVEYQFDRTLPTTASSGWQSSPTWTNTGLTAGTSYTYTVTVRDGRGNTSPPSSPVSAVASDTAGPVLPISVAHWQMQPYATIDNKVCMTAQPVTESGAFVYYQCVSGGGPDSGWLPATTTDDSGKSYYVKWTTPAALADGTYSYQYKLKDATGNESPYSTTYSAKITPTTGYHACTFAQAATLPDDNLVSFNGVVLQANADNYLVKDVGSTATIIVKSDQYAQATDPGKVLKLCQIKGHLWTYGTTRQVTYAAVTPIMDPPSFAISGKVSEASGGAAIAGATVYFATAPGAAANAILTATTDAGGNYSKAVPNGVWYVAAASANHFPSSDQSLTVNGYAVANFNFSLNPAETITVTAGAGGSVTPSGPVLLVTGANQTFTITPNGGRSIGSVLIDGIDQGSITSYVFSNVNSNHSIAVSFTANTVHTPQTASLIDSALAETFPNSGATGNWASYLPAGKTYTAMGTPTVTTANSAKWDINAYADGDGFDCGDHGSTAIPCNGASIVAVVKPLRNATGTSWSSVVDIFYSRFVLSVQNSTGEIRVCRNGTWFGTGSIIPSGQVTVICVICQADGTFKVYANGTQVYSTPSTSAMTSLVPGVAGTYATHINVGRNNPDGWSTFNGNIGDFFIYNMALSDAERQALEGDMTTKFGIATPRTITASADTGGSISPAGGVSVANGGAATFVCRPDIGYTVGQMTVDGVSQGAISSYTFSDVSANHTISATFTSVPTYTLSASAGTHGTISPAGATTVNAGTSQAFTITPDTGYQVSGLLVDGVSQGSATSYTFANVQAAHTILATFTLKVCTIAASAASGGTISPSGSTNVNYGANQTFTITPNTNYAVSSVIVDGMDLGAVTSYTFGSVIVNHTISAVFIAGARKIPAADQLMFGMDTKDIVGTTSITSWPWLWPTGGSLTNIVSPTVQTIGGVKWESNSYTDNDGFRVGQYNSAIPVTGATIVCAIKPARNGTSTGWTSIVDVMYGEMVLGVNNATGIPVVRLKKTNTSGSTAIPDGQATILTLVVQPAGAYTIYANGVSIMTGTGPAMTEWLPGNTTGNNTSFDTYINIGRNNPDGWSTFNGNIGDVFLYKTALTDTQRLCLEADMMSKFGIGGGTGGTYTITASTGSNGTISPSGATVVNSGTNQSYTITPSAGYAVADVQIDGISMGVAGSYTFSNVLASHTISATFGVASSYSVTATASAGGTISPNGTVTVTSGQNQAFTISPNSGYVVLDVTVDGVSQGEVTGYTFNNVVTNHTINASFTPIILNPSVTLARHAGTGSSSAYGDTLVFDVTVLGTPMPTGTVTLKDGGANGTTLGSGSLTSGAGTITPAYNALTVGSHSNIVAVYNGDSHFPVLVSPTLDTQTVSQVPLTVTGLTGSSKTYDGTTTAPLTGTPILSGVLGSDRVSVGNAASGNFADPNVGTAKPITTALTLTGSAAANYVLTQPSGLTGNITARVVTLTGSKTYDGTASVAVGNLAVSNNVDGVNLTVTGNASLTAKDVGTQALVIGSTTPTRVGSAASGAVGGTAASSFNVTMGAAPTGGNTLVAVIETRGNSANRVTGLSQAGALWTKAVGAEGITTTTGSTSTTEIWYASNVSTSAGAGVTINLAASYYAAAVIAEYAGVLTANPLDKTANRSNGSNSTTATTGTTVASTQANELWVGAVGLVNSGYTLGSITNSFGSVASANSTGSAGSNAKVYMLERIVTTTGTAGSGGTVSTSSRASGAIATFKASPSLTLAGSAAANYTLTGASGTVSVTPKSISATGLAGSSRYYDGGTVAVLTGTAVLPAAEAGGTGASDDGKPYIVDTLTLGGTASGVFADRHVGTGKPVTVSGLTLGAANAGNYTLVQPSGLTATVSALPITVIAVTATKTYDGTTSASGTPTITPALATGDTATALSQAFQTSAAGEGNKTIIPAITINDGNGGANYQVTLQNFIAGTIHKATATITLANLAQMYDGTQKAVTFTTHPTGCAADLTYNGSASAPTSAGSYVVVATINDANYAGTASDTLVIAEAPIVTWRNNHFTPAEIAAGLAADDADPDGDGASNLAEFAFDGNPRSGASSGFFLTKLADGPDGDTTPELSFTCAVRRGAAFSPGPNNAVVSASVDGLVYTIEGSSTPGGPWNAQINDLGASDTPPAASGLPDLTGSAWQYHTFSAFNGIPGKGFIRAVVAKP